MNRQSMLATAAGLLVAVLVVALLATAGAQQLPATTRPAAAPSPAPPAATDAAVAAAPAPVAAPGATAQPGKMAPDFALTDVFGKTHRLSDYRGKTVLVTFISVRCPWSLGYDSEHRRLWRQVVEKSPGKVQFLGINSNVNDTPTEVLQHMVAKDLTFPVLKDPGNRVADAYRATTTPQVYIVDPHGLLVYMGQPCDVGPTAGSPNTKANSIAPILDALAAGGAVEPKTTSPWGCTIKRGVTATQSAP